MECMKKFIASIKYAMKGIGIYSKERNAKIQISMAVIYSCTALFLDYNFIEWCIVLLCFGLVFTAEAINTAIEYLVDLVSPDYDEKAGKVKDIAAGAVLMSALFVGIVGILLVLNKVMNNGCLN